ncbi:MAG: trifunctional serine/threonine-protein kinase/ATP-binding protein/SpoIIE family protein phosphatase [Spirochaetes bacterium]|jgi:predicted ATPase/serine phosphatase RsbU (regulator of sigma subunit)/tRNA A-37 threonylcarbamoyl transferase component Bud32|nr:trifunctional serine/threonine-protein kinase/ATP-binding protein/SpoIIE family protein phosphatase [Spirochaetota bacterium]
MKTISDYTVIEKISETGKSIIYRAQKERDKKKYIIKVLKNVYPSPSETARFRQEYEIIKKLDMDGIVKTYDIINFENNFAIILEDFSGISMKKYILENKMSPGTFLDFSIIIAGIIGELHEKGIIHKDIKPHNILINPDTKKLKITDFGIASELTHSRDEIYNPEVITGTLAYMSPEQTGRMNRAIDYRTDIYSLGITFYEMLTGNVPFISKDPMELIHSHIARKPIPPGEINPAVTGQLNNIILKLLAKTAEERYQNSYGLMKDLIVCRDQLSKTGSIGNFELASEDISLKFNIPQILVGRQKEIEILIEVFNRISEGNSEIVFVSGPPGVGKSALINELHKYVITKRAYFITGKYEQFRNEVPYSSLIQAFQQLSRHILSESKEQISKWKELLNVALGANGKIITDVIPEIEMIIGKQPPVLGLGPNETQNRFNFIFKKFISVFSQHDHPVVFFLDDLQWIDPASLNLIKTLVTDMELRHFMLIGSFRDSEVYADHPLNRSIEDIKKSGIRMTPIRLNPLGPDDINRLILNFLKCDAATSRPLAETVYKKTNGNPFFINQFLKALYEGEILKLVPGKGWMWNIEDIDIMQVTDNVVNLMAEKISKLPEKTQAILKLCSCIGNRFKLETLSIITGKTVDETLNDLNTAMEEGLISLTNKFYMFHHDRIQEAAYSLIPERDKINMHYKIGNTVLDNCAESDLGDNIFYIVNQLNLGLELIASDSERMKIAGLNLLAGKKAKDSTAYSSARNYLKAAVSLLDSKSWYSEYRTTFEIHRELMECEYLNGNFADAEKLFMIILDNARTDTEKASVYNIMVVLYTTKGKMREAVDLGLKGLKILGIKLSMKPSKLSLLLEIIKSKIYIKKIGIKNIPDIHELNDPLKLSITDLINSVGTPSYYISPDLFAFIVTRFVNFYLKNGISNSSAFAFMAYATIIGSALGDYKSGQEIAEAALALNDRFKNKKIMCKVNHTYAFFIQHWRNHAKNDIKFSRKAYMEGLESGDMMYAGHSINVWTMTRTMTGDNLDEIFKEYGAYAEFQKKTNDPFIMNNYADNNRLFHVMKGLTDGKSTMNGGNYSEEKRLSDIRSGDNLLDLFYHLLLKMKILYIFGQFHDCLVIGKELESIVNIPMGNLHVAEFYFYYSLAITAYLPTLFDHEKRVQWKTLGKNQKKMKKWAENCPDNFLHKYLIIESEKASLLNQKEKAMKLYHDSIISASQSGYTQNEALANELASKYYMGLGYDEIAKIYLSRARYCYTKWGATAKVKDLEEHHPGLLYRQKNSMDDSFSTDSGTSEGSSDVLDISTIMKASQIISSEIVLEKLLMNLMIIAVENAGAEKGFLILEQDGMLLIEANADINNEKINLLQSVPVENSEDLSSAIVYYVARTKESVILSDASNDGIFSGDEYIRKMKPKSILCDPIINQGKLSGILYLENNLSTGVFTQERLKILRVLSTQVAISIDNARLYSNLEAMVKKRTAELEEVRDQLWGEMKLAKKIQTVLLPDRPTMKGYEVIGHMIPSEEVGGDYYDVINTEYSDWVFIGDVSGHGVSAGLVMMMVQSTIQSIIRENPLIKPTGLLKIINKGITYNIKKLDEDKFMTMTALNFYEDGRVVHSGLHLDILVYRNGRAEVEVIKTSGMWLGVVDDLSKFNRDVEFRLYSGDVVLLFSDGLIEARDKNLKMFDIENLINVFSFSAKNRIEEIKNNILNALSDYTTDDDKTMIIIKKL